MKRPRVIVKQKRRVEERIVRGRQQRRLRARQKMTAIVWHLDEV